MGSITTSEAQKIGWEVENTIKRILETDGYIAVKSARSQGPFDLVGIKEGKTRLIQAKSIPTSTDWEQATRLAKRVLRRYVKMYQNLLGPLSCIEVWVWFPDGRIRVLCTNGCWSGHQGIWHPERAH